MNSIKVALIGCGAAAMRYYVPAFKKHKQLLAGLHLIDVDRKNAEIVRKALGGGQIGTSYEDVLSKVGGAIILLPNHIHHKVAMDCLNAGLHVLCEKPLAVLPEHASEMVDAAERNNVLLCVNNTRRMFPNFITVKQILQSGELGRPTEIEYIEGNTFGWQSSTGFYVNPRISSKGILLDLGSHVMDTICWWLGGKPDIKSCIDDSYGGPESVVKLKAMKNDCILKVTLNRLCELSNTFKVVCEKGIITGRIFDWKSITVKDFQGKVVKKKLKCPVKNYPGFVVPVVENFFDAVAGKQSPLVSGKDVFESIEFIHECYNQRKRFALSWDRNIEFPFSESKNGIEDSKEKKILVTGATGFVGGRVVEMLHLAGYEHYKVVAGIRQWGSAARLGRFPVDIVTMDLMEKDQIAKGLEGVTHVIHCAKGTPEATVEGTRNLLDISLQKGIHHFIHISTAEVYGNASGLVDESCLFQYTGNAYNKMKIDAEKVCWEYVDKGFPITIFRPSIIYGPYSNSWILRFASLMLSGEWGIYENYGEGICNLIYIDDFVKSIISVLDNKAFMGKAFNLNGPEIITWNEYFKKLNEKMDLPPLKRIYAKKADMITYTLEPVRILGGFVKKHFFKPVKILAESSTIVDCMLRKVEHQVKAKPAADELKLFAKNVVYSDSSIKSFLTRPPCTSVMRGIKYSVDFLRYLEKIDNRQGLN